MRKPKKAAKKLTQEELGDRLCSIEWNLSYLTVFADSISNLADKIDDVGGDSIAEIELLTAPIRSLSLDLKSRLEGMFKEINACRDALRPKVVHA